MKDNRSESTELPEGMIFMAGKTKNKKRKQQGDPRKAAVNVKTSAETENELIRKSIDPPMRRGDKPLFMRIVMLAIAAVMILGIVMGAVAGNAGSFF